MAAWDVSLTVAGSGVDLEARSVELESLCVSYNRFRTLTFRQKTIHTSPLYALQQDVVATIAGTVAFRGKIKDLAQEGTAESESVLYTAYGLREQAAEVNVRDAAGNPRVVFNAPYEDEDFDSSRQNWSLGEMIKWLFTQHDTELSSKGVISVGSLGYQQTDLDCLHWTPNKVVLYTEDFDGALTQILRLAPGYAFVIDPSLREYRFRKLFSLPLKTITYNSSADLVQRASINPTTRDRYTAVRVVGSKRQRAVTVTQSAGQLSELWNDALEADWTWDKAFSPPYTDTGTLTTATASAVSDSSRSWTPNKWQDGLVTVLCSGTGGLVYYQAKRVKWNTLDVVAVKTNFSPIVPSSGYQYWLSSGVSPYRYVYSRWQITTPSMRHIAKETTWSGTSAIGGLTIELMKTGAPQVYVKTALSTISTWYSWFPVAAHFEHRVGIFTTKQPMYRGNGNLPGSASAPIDIRLDYSYLSDPTSVRVPTTAHTGTAYTSWGVEREMAIYDEEFENESQIDKYLEIAKELLDAFKDVLFEGDVKEMKLDGAYRNLGYRVNVAAQTDAGSPIVTKLESIGAIVTECEYDFADHSTRLTLTTGLELTYEGIKRTFSDEARLQLDRALGLFQMSLHGATSREESIPDGGTPSCPTDTPCCEATDVPDSGSEEMEHECCPQGTTNKWSWSATGANAWNSSGTLVWQGVAWAGTDGDVGASLQCAVVEGHPRWQLNLTVGGQTCTWLSWEDGGPLGDGPDCGVTCGGGTFDSDCFLSGDAGPEGCSEGSVAVAPV